MRRSPAPQVAAVLCAASLLLPASGLAQQINGEVREWSAPGYQPYDIVTTPDGMVWMTHSLAVVRFDPSTGSTLGLYPPGPDKSLQTIMRAPDGLLWIADLNDTLHLLDPDSLIFTTLALPAATFPEECGPRDLAVGPDNAIWFTCSKDRTIGRLGYAATWSRFFVAGGRLPDAPEQLVFDPDGIAWITIRADAHSSPGFAWLDPDDPSVVSSGWLTSAGFDRPFDIVYLNDSIWLVDHGWNLAESQIVEIDRSTKAHTHYQLPDEVDDAHFLAVGHDGKLYTAGLVSHSVASFDPVTHDFQILDLPSDDAWPMGITTDVDGALWIAESGPPGESGGVARLWLHGPDTLAIGVLESLSGVEEGAVAVLYGSREDGLSSDANQLITEDSPGTDDTAEDADAFGYAVASGDFNGDLVDDLAVGVPAEDVNGKINAGAVHVFYGTRNQLLQPAKDEIWDQDSGLGGAAEDGDSFGRALASGDFNRDGFDDLAVGIPWEDIGTSGGENAGAVAIILGSANGLTATGTQLWLQGKNGIAGSPEPDDGFGTALAAGDFDGDGFDDLAIGVPTENWSTIVDSGCVQVLYGALAGLTWSGDQLWRHGADGVQDATEAGDLMGAALAVGRFNDDEYDDLAIGAPGETITGEPGAGAVNILYGSSSGLSGTGDQMYDQSNLSIDGELEDGDMFASALAAGDLDGDGIDDLAIGVPYESVGSVLSAGAVNVLYGTGSGISSAGSDYWHQNSTGIGSFIESGDRFGSSLTIGDLNDDGFDDLVVGVTYEDISPTNAGAAHVIYGSGAGLTGTDSWFIHQGLASIVDDDEELDRFGWSMCTLRGLSTVLYADGFEHWDTSRWSSTVP